MQRKRAILVVAMWSIVVVGCTSVDPTPTLTPSPESSLNIEVTPPPPFMLSDHENGDDVAHLLSGVGPEKTFPPELLDSAPVLSHEEAARKWQQFLLNTRIFRLDDRGVNEVQDHCGGEGLSPTSTLKYIRDLGWVAESKYRWDVEPQVESAWNRPVFSFGPVRDTVNPPESGIPISVDRNFRGARSQLTLRIFSHSDCEEIIPITIFTAAQLDLIGATALGAGALRSFPRELLPDSPQLEEGELFRVYREFFDRVVIIDNFTALPVTYSCGDDSAMVLNQYGGPGRLGRIEYGWWEDAREVYKNAIRIRHAFLGRDPSLAGGLLGEPVEIDHDGDGTTITLIPTFDEISNPSQRLDPYAAYSTYDVGEDCSYEKGLEYVEKLIRDKELEKYGYGPIGVLSEALTLDLEYLRNN